MNKSPAIISGTLFFWAGFVCSISFMEAWLKFRAPGVTLPIGLSIGKLVFTALNRMEWVFLLLFSIMAAPRFKNLPKKVLTLSVAVTVVLLTQTIWLLPRLTQRAEQIIAGNEPGESAIHLVFGILEVSKVALLIYLGYFFGKNGTSILKKAKTKE